MNFGLNNCFRIYISNKLFEHGILGYFSVENFNQGQTVSKTMGNNYTCTQPHGHKNIRTGILQIQVATNGPESFRFSFTAYIVLLKTTIKYDSQDESEKVMYYPARQYMRIDLWLIKNFHKQGIHHMRPPKSLSFNPLDQLRLVRYLERD